MKTAKLALTLIPVALAVAGCTTGHTSAEYDKMTMEVVKASFVERGIAKLDRLEQDEARLACWQSEVSGKPLDEKTAKAIEEAAYKSVKWPSDGKFLGDWKEGEKIAQSGRGLTWSDDEKTVNGGNCYNCHQITKEEISYGTLGPSLYNYGKLRGVTDPNSPAAKPIIEYTWAKIWNSRAFNACTKMPSAGHRGILNEQQIKHVMALLLDPNSPVNK
ncbi:sulfur oxidation c-type cytochrome SoxX [Tepidimonas taiwanensis]|uniref:Sulfur oxidation c-type cytochrome SoxX n=1 Tax=Tepidimonas taiwanensis TaxID=307486 RepID=A0A554X9L2_9BURK|nr:sulfur oxidation c-type cytochrome SoxX [Tepidimonas taiwanensis]MCX7693410.1 sulfur oxidation c-type cytochrome SoxX [Tepidimonas taiwanensis]MDM7463234.1 sulfur oxidation c-type cytochrome SoxX [Tepidimonas taiwanensis]TSE32511.1 sulfur oxidation c-type cytochrome SoxX [Tepidimonas taiwanensis]UBQ06495.1 sulfur oxidation c-type cytochrome SoxX [Tepidimonas taiwanensis]